MRAKGFFMIPGGDRSASGNGCTIALRQSFAIETPMRVYHTKQLTFGGMADEPQPRWPQDYELVAEIDQGGRTSRDALDHAFHLTQNIERRWTENEGVRAFGARRSTSAGDAVALEDGSLYRCEMNGWTPIGTTWVGRTQEESQRRSNERNP